MEFTFDDLTWYWFRGNDVNARLLQDVCLFRSHVLYDGGTRKNFGHDGVHFGDVHYTDFDSYHIVACRGREIVGVIRVTPAKCETVTESVLGRMRFAEYLQHLETDRQHTLEINRLMIDPRYRKSNLGRTLMYAAVALIHRQWDRSIMTVIGAAGNITRQVDFFLKYTDYHRVEGWADEYAPAFSDHVSFMVYERTSYTRGLDWIEFFKREFQKNSIPIFRSFEMGYDRNEIPGLDIAPSA